MVDTSQPDINAWMPWVCQVLSENMSEFAMLLEADEPFRVLWANPAHYEHLPSMAASSVGKPLAEVFPGIEESGLLDVFRRVAGTGKPVERNEFELAYPGVSSDYTMPGNMTYWSGKLLPVKDDAGRVQMLLIIGRDVTERKARELVERQLQESLNYSRFLLRRRGLLVRIQQAISSHLAQHDVLDMVIHSAMQLLDLPAAAVFMLNPDGRTFTPTVSESIHEVPREYTIENSLAGRVAKSRQIAAISDTTDIKDLLLPVLENGEPARALVVAPIVLDRNLVGVLEVYSTEPHTFADTDIQTVSILADHAAVAINNARLYETLSHERARLQTILDTVPAGVIVAEGPDVRVSMQNPRSIELYGTVPPLGVSVRERLAQLGICRTDGALYNPDELPLVRAALRSEAVRGEEMVLQRPDGHWVYLLANATPVLDTSGRTTGAVMAFVDITDLKKAQEQLREAYTKERYISETLQKAFLPTVPSQVRGIRLASEYHPAYAEAMVGGDFYDVFVPSPGLISLVVGDVSGKGVNAAVYTALAKYSLRACAYDNPDPLYVMERLNTAAYSQLSADAFITVFYGLLNLEVNTLYYINAGHMPPLHLTCSECKVIQLSCGGVPIGVLPTADYNQNSLRFKRDDRLLLYTDGVTEARGSEGFYGMENLSSFLLSEGKETPTEFVGDLIHELEQWTAGHLTDDVAILLISVE